KSVFADVFHIAAAARVVCPTIAEAKSVISISGPLDQVHTPGNRQSGVCLSEANEAGTALDGIGERCVVGVYSRHQQSASRSAAGVRLDLVIPRTVIDGEGVHPLVSAGLMHCGF